jgi:hypothetical protein
MSARLCVAIVFGTQIAVFSVAAQRLPAGPVAAPKADIAPHAVRSANYSV